jgi:hypothetical protein
MAFCTKCGRSNQQGSRFCNSCGATMYGASARSVSAPKQTAPSARRADAATVLARPQVVVVQGGIKSSGLAAVLSFFWCGLGHVYTGRIGTGLALMLIHPAVLVFGFMLAFGGLAGLGGGAFLLGLLFLLSAVAIWIYGMTNAYHTAERINQQAVTHY